MIELLLGVIFIWMWGSIEFWVEMKLNKYIYIWVIIFNEEFGIFGENFIGYIYMCVNI